MIMEMTYHNTDQAQRYFSGLDSGIANYSVATLVVAFLRRRQMFSKTFRGRVG